MVNRVPFAGSRFRKIAQSLDTAVEVLNNPPLLKHLVDGWNGELAKVNQLLACYEIVRLRKDERVAEYERRA
jgi:hypothetical protein